MLIARSLIILFLIWPCCEFIFISSHLAYCNNTAQTRRAPMQPMNARLDGNMHPLLGNKGLSIVFELDNRELGVGAKPSVQPVSSTSQPAFSMACHSNLLQMALS